MAQRLTLIVNFRLNQQPASPAEAARKITDGCRMGRCRNMCQSNAGQVLGGELLEPFDHRVETVSALGAEVLV